jgi:hypothetical protein
MREMPRVAAATVQTWERETSSCSRRREAMTAINTEVSLTPETNPMGALKAAIITRR